MPAASHHVAVLTDDPEAIHRFLTEVVGLAVHLEFTVPGEDLVRSAGWPPNEGASVVMYGTPPAGIVEVIAIPASLRDRIAPRIWLASFATKDLDDRVALARRLGFAASDPFATTGEVALRASMVEVGGISWELVGFGR
jgi:catechol 2,3-dioxygenase-like lactoylglutathione lyase family enzyme